MSRTAQTVTLKNGILMPQIGLGVWQASGKDATQAVRWALDAGYRLIDTASFYGNEKQVGIAIRESGIPRGEIFVTTKLWNDDQGYEPGLRAIDRSLQLLGMDYVDLYLIHWPFIDWSHMNPDDDNLRAETWRAMEEIHRAGKAKAIGVCNYEVGHLKEMEHYADILPMVDQFELHPFWRRKELTDFCGESGIAVEAYSPLSRGRKLMDERITTIAKKYGKSNAQILLRWNVQHGSIVIPKSIHRERIEENFHIFDFVLAEEDMKALDALNENWSVIFSEYS